MVEYIISKIRAYISHMETIVLFNRSVSSYCNAFAQSKEEYEIDDSLKKVVSMFGKVWDKAEETAGIIAEYTDHPNDFAILFLLIFG